MLLIEMHHLLLVTAQNADKATKLTYAMTLSSLLMRPVRAPTTSWEAKGSPRELIALTARLIWLMVESSLTAARRMSRVSLDTGIYIVKQKKTICLGHAAFMSISNKMTYEKEGLRNICLNIVQPNYILIYCEYQEWKKYPFLVPK